MYAFVEDVERVGFAFMLSRSKRDIAYLDGKYHFHDELCRQTFFINTEQALERYHHELLQLQAVVHTNAWQPHTCVYKLYTSEVNPYIYIYLYSYLYISLYIYKHT